MCGSLDNSRDNASALEGDARVAAFASNACCCCEPADVKPTIGGVVACAEAMDAVASDSASAVVILEIVIRIRSVPQVHVEWPRKAPLPDLRRRKERR